MAAASQTAHQAEFHFTHEHFELLREYIREHSGIALSDAKRQLVYTRLVRRLRSLKLTGFEEYCNLIRRRDHKERVELVNAITTNLTGFFREPHHFDYLARAILLDLMGRDPCNRRLRLWSAGCSTGEEPYSMAIVARESVPQGTGWDLKILATELSRQGHPVSHQTVSEVLQHLGYSLQRMFLHVGARHRGNCMFIKAFYAL